MCLLQLLQGDRGITVPLPSDLHIRNPKIGNTFHRQLKHSQSVDCRCNDFVRFVRRISIRQHQHFIQSKAVIGILSQRQMHHMHRVKGTSHDSDTFSSAHRKHLL